jgi:hypothetical protein
VKKIDVFFENLEFFVTMHPVLSLFLGLMVAILIGLVLWAMVLSCVCIWAKYSCCKRSVYYVNKKNDSLTIPPPPPPPTPATPTRIDAERKKTEEQHPIVERVERAKRQQVMILDERGNIPVYTLRSRSVDGTSGGFTTVMNMDVKPPVKKYQETEL